MGIDVSVIVPTRNRCGCLERLLDSVFHQTLPVDRFEVIVVSDGSTDGTADLVRTAQATHKNLRLLEQACKGPAAARNTGVGMARGQFLAFTDDDCVVSPDWLEQLVGAFARTSAVGIQGRTTTDWDKRTPLTNEVINEHGTCGVPTCNAAYRKTVYEAVGGFDESFRFPHNEDAEFAWRVERLGPIVFVPEVHVHHPPRMETLSKRAYWVRYLETEFLLRRKHPELYRQRCGSSPWLTIYWRGFVVTQLKTLRNNLRYLLVPFRPTYFVQGNALVLLRWWNLIRFYPHYLRAARKYGLMASERSLAQPARLPTVPALKAGLDGGEKAETISGSGRQ